MRKFTKILTLGLMLLLAQAAIQAQITTGSISGTVTDASGAVVPGASVSVKGQAGNNYSATTNGEGYFIIPGVAAGTPTYTVTITAPNFKTSVIQNVKVDVATPATVNTVLQAGQISEQVVVTSGAEVLQTETATVGTTIQGRQILETPIQSRDALDLVTLLPGTATLGVARTSSINGLPKSAMTIQIDGVDVQDNYLKSSDGFFTFIRPRIDAIDEVTVSTATPGAESSGDGAVAIRFQTRRGTDDYKGSAFYQHRDESLNASNTFNNFSNLPKQKLRLNQFGWSYGGPIPFLNFGEGVKAFDSGKGKRYFFANYERFHLNEVSPIRTRTVLTTDAQNGIYRYGVNGAQSVNLFNLAATYDCDPGAGVSFCLLNTIDPTVNSMLNTIRTATGTTGQFQPLGTGGLYFRQNYQFNNPGEQRRRFLVVRTDFNIAENHALEVVFNDQPFRANVDFLNSFDPTFPGIANAGTQESDRRSLSIGFRSSFGGNWVNQFRYAQLSGWLGGASGFSLVGGEQFFDNTQGGYSIGLASATGLTIRNADSARSSPTRDFTDNVTWVKGNHTFTFGGQYKTIETISDSRSPIRPTVGFGVLTTGGPGLCGSAAGTGDGCVINAFSATAGSLGVGTSATDVSNAQALYATLTGRVSSFGSTAYLEGNGLYRANGSRHFEIEEQTNGLYIQDSWRIRPNMTLSYGIRWQPQLGATLNTTNYALLSDPIRMAFDISGFGNMFGAGANSTGLVPTFRQATLGEKAYPNDYKNFAPSVGFVWSPGTKSGFIGTILGKDGTSVFRGGWSRAFIREGTLTVENSIGLNPGGTFSLSRSAAVGAAYPLTVGSYFRTPGNPNLTIPAFNPVPVFPRAVNPVSDATFAFGPGFHSGYVDSWSFGYQRQFGRDTVVEFRYVGNRGKEMQTQYRVNEVNAIENGFGAEFALAQQNLLANILCANTVGCVGGGAHFRYRGPGTGTSPLPIIVSFFSGNGVDPNSAASYGSTLYANTTFLGQLNPANPSVQGMINTLDVNFRANTLTAGAFQGAKPANFTHTCPNTNGFCYIFDNSERSWYDSGTIEVRRRLTAGIRVNASYVWGKSYTNTFASAGDSFFGSGAGDQSNVSSNSLRNRNLDKSLSQIDIRHAFKFDSTIDLPFGKGRRFASSSNWASNAFLGGWTIAPTVRWQSGSPILMENVQFVGMTGKDLQKKVGVYYNQVINGVTVPVSYLPADIIINTIRAFTFATPSVTNATGYSTTLGPPTGAFIAPAGYANCQARSLGQCGNRKFVLYGPNFFKLDASVLKKIAIGEKRNVELRATFFDVLNRTNWRLGGWTSNVSNITAFTGTFGQMLSGWSYQDPSGSNDPGGRLIDLMLRINF
ncbi:MAG TPA: carboxypeptidase-like regulatory domain-containing protein [Pyrinomonadaceae bacterium]|nr:carboxypeptidase-like regulatory domain-containing protein [Pyrinomonadaceae bacterium]